MIIRPALFCFNRVIGTLGLTVTVLGAAPGVALAENPWSAQSLATWFPVQPGPAQVKLSRDGAVLQNKVLRATVTTENGGTIQFENLLDGSSQRVSGPRLVGGGFGLGLTGVGSPKMSRIKPNKRAVRLADGVGAYEVTFTSPANQLGYAMRWNLELRDGANAVRETVTVTRNNSAMDKTASRIDLIAFDSTTATAVGTVPGSPIVAGNSFFGIEFPMAVTEVANGHARASIERKVAITPGHPAEYSAVLGIAPAGQMRRAFLWYTERERAHPYRPFLHYNSWYDIGYFTPYTADQCVERINAFGQELSVKRGVKLSSFLFDDGWDDYTKVWDFSKDFPQGFLPLKAAAAQYGAGPGVWLSPWGGYGHPREVRLAAGKKLGYEIDSEGYALSGPKYYARFHDKTMEFVTHQGVNQFKFDGTGSPDKQYPGSAFSSDFEAAIHLIGDLRAAKPDLFVNLTTGTWPSPFWTRYADSIWRGGSDHSFAGVGTYRQQWITYKDGDTYNGVVRRGPLYPINSLMLHGIIYAQNANHLDTDPGNDFRDEVREYFATGTQLQEMYVTPKLLTEQNWDDLAEAAKWAAINASILVDSHWVGGDPMKLEVYGHAAWTGGTGILVLRNPSDKPQAYSVDIAKELQLPSGIHGAFVGKSPWKSEANQGAMSFRVGASKVVVLQPFQILTLEGEVAR